MQWTLTDKLTVGGFALMLVLAIVALLTPEIRLKLGLDKPKPVVMVQDSVLPPPKAKSNEAPPVAQSVQKIKSIKNSKANIGNNSGTKNVIGDNNKIDSPSAPTQVAAPNGIAISGGIVTNPTVNNFGPPIPTVSFKIEDKPALRNARPPTGVGKTSIDKSFTDPRFAVQCDRPCKPVQAQSSDAGIILVTWGNAAGDPNIALAVVNEPNPMPYNASLLLCIESEDDEPVKILKVGRFVLSK